MNNFDYYKEYSLPNAPEYKYILVSDKEIKSEDVI